MKHSGTNLTNKQHVLLKKWNKGKILTDIASLKANKNQWVVSKYKIIFMLIFRLSLDLLETNSEKNITGEGNYRRLITLCNGKFLASLIPFTKA